MVSLDHPIDGEEKPGRLVAVGNSDTGYTYVSEKS
jgi:hypothetical protein